MSSFDLHISIHWPEISSMNKIKNYLLGFLLMSSSKIFLPFSYSFDSNKYLAICDSIVMTSCDFKHCEALLKICFGVNDSLTSWLSEYWLIIFINWIYAFIYLLNFLSIFRPNSIATYHSYFSAKIYKILK